MNCVLTVEPYKNVKKWLKHILEQPISYLIILLEKKIVVIECYFMIIVK